MCCPQSIVIGSTCSTTCWLRRHPVKVVGVKPSFKKYRGKALLGFIESWMPQELEGKVQISFPRVKWFTRSEGGYYYCWNYQITRTIYPQLRGQKLFFKQYLRIAPLTGNNPDQKHAFLQNKGRYFIFAIADHATRTRSGRGPTMRNTP